MKLGFYFGLAKDGIRKNSKMYTPYILTCIGMVMMYYIILSLQTDKTIGNMAHGSDIQMVLGFGGWVIAIFSCIFLFYTNSFLIRRRKKEFGLYNILGMGRRHISLIILCESVIVAVVALALGLFTGVLFSKFAELGLINIIDQQVNYSFFIAPKAIISTIKIFGCTFVLLFLNNLRQLYFTSTIELLGSEKAGEKPPKANWLVAIAGLVLLGIAYYISVTIKNPLAAFSVFFIAVVLVILATYLLMIAGSVVMCRILQKNKTYYYKKNHFVSVSSMAYRMKRNGAGLASICILATMVLVIISSTSCLYFGHEDALNRRYPRQIDFGFDFTNATQATLENVKEIQNGLNQAIEECGVESVNKYTSRSASIAGALEGNKLTTSVGAYGDKGISEMERVIMLYFIPIEDYNEATGKNVVLEDNEALCYFSEDFDEKSLQVDDMTTFTIKEKIDKCPNMDNVDFEVVPVMVMYLADYDSTLQKMQELEGLDGESRLIYSLEYGFDTTLSGDKQIEAASQIKEKFLKNEYEYNEMSMDVREAQRQDFFVAFGGLFYLGILLSVVFIFAAVLIIYYKQISEGYEDHSRFDIMRKVGMTDKEIRKSINSQMLTVFFFPLILAGIHICFAFPIVRKLLMMFSLNNVGLFVETSIISFLIFGVLYAIVYRITSNAYYRIVRTNM
ncbi:MAG: ABC transporter permease [Agathobacter sp.]|nr:ABC transporter permease [Agathobacter sp.]